MAEAVPQDRGDGGGEDEEEQYRDDRSEDFHASMLLRCAFNKQWQKCPKSYNFCHNGSMLKSVAVIVVPNFSIFEFATACEVFGIDRSERGGNVPAFDFRVCTLEPGDVGLKSGLSMNVPLGLEATADADLVIMAPYGRDNDVPESVMEALRAADARGAWVMSICSGAFALARAGLLNGRRCTTHWHVHSMSSRPVPDVRRWSPKVATYVDDGPVSPPAQAPPREWTPCLHLGGWSFGANVAATVARHMVVPPQRAGGQAQFIRRPVPTCGSAPRHWGRCSPGSCRTSTTAPVGRCARRRQSTCPPGRSLAASDRRPGTTRTPGSIRQRVLRAEELLKCTVASTSTKWPGRPGTGHPVLLRHHFAKVLDTSRSPTAVHSGGSWQRRVRRTSALQVPGS